MCFHAMMLCWRLSEKHWLLTPFSWLGDWLEDFGLDRGYITIKPGLIDPAEIYGEGWEKMLEP